MSTLLVERHRLTAFLFCFLLSTAGTAWSHKSLAAGSDSAAEQRPLRVVTINVWSGLDYHGFFNFGEYEPAKRRELRFQLLLRQLKSLDPDVVFIQEANPVGRFSSRLADSLSFDEIHQVCNAGIKPIVVGPPLNFKEGIAILARKKLRLKAYGVWKLSGSFGLYGDDVSLNFDESEFAQAAQIEVNGLPLFIVNTHLSAFPPDDSLIEAAAENWLASGNLDSATFKSVNETLRYGSARRQKEVETLLENVGDLPAGVPVILAGDFNSRSDSKEISSLVHQGDFLNAGDDFGLDDLYTWNPTRNSNVSYSTNFSDAGGETLDLAEKLSAVYDSRPRTIDYVFLNRKFTRGDVRNARVVLDSSYEGIHASDHFGVMADIDLSTVQVPDENSVLSETRSSIEPLPILSYDTDTHFGYGAKIFLFDLLKMKESFDFVLFNSTKGERWYRGVFSYPDLEWREGTEYPFAIDLTFDYDKWLKNNFYGVGNESSFADGEQYTRVPIELSAALSRGFTPEFVGQLILRYKSIEDYGFDSTSRLRELPPSLNSSTAEYSSVDLNFRYDTRNSFVNPSEGLVLLGESEYAPSGSTGNVSFVRLAGWFQYYHMLFYPPTVFAIRAGVQQVIGNNLPVQVLTSIGGNSTMRGYPQDRFLDKAGALINAELRFPIVWRFGGVVGLDAGKVWSSMTRFDLVRWATNPVVGVRLYMDNYVVRADLGFGHEGTGFYFNFGQMF